MKVLTIKALTGAIAAAALVFSSTGAVASNSAVAAQTQASPWALLSVMSGGASAVAACGSAATAATAAQPTGGCVLPQTDVAPVAQVPLETVPAATTAPGFGISPLLLGLAALAAGIGLYFVLRSHGNNANSPA